MSHWNFLNTFPSSIAAIVGLGPLTLLAKLSATLHKYLALNIPRWTTWNGIDL